jgi:hypothetical protein
MVEPSFKGGRLVQLPLLCRELSTRYCTLYTLDRREQLRSVDAQGCALPDETEFHSHTASLTIYVNL